MAFPDQFNLSQLNGSNGFVINGIDANDYSGRSVSSLGDVNGDGIDDIIIGANGAKPNDLDGAGESYVVFGSLNGLGSSLDLSQLDGNNGFVLKGIDAFDFSGGSVSSLGDVNGDGIDDIIIGANGADPSGNDYAGESYVVFGSNGFGASLDLSSLDGSNGFVINGIDALDLSGYSVSSAGDVNGDGIDDIVIGAYAADPNDLDNAGESYVIFGSNGFGASLDLSSLDGTNGFVINGIDALDLSGYSVSSAGDVNGDSIDDIIIGANGADPSGNSNAGESYVVFGSNGFGASLDLSSLDGNNGFVINGIDAGDNSGRSVSSAGDVNADGIDDVIIGARDADPNGNNNAGESYVVFGSNGSEASLDLSSLDGSNGFVINGIDADDSSGRSVSSVGDVNGDGIDDIIIGASGADPNGNTYSGESYVVFGTSSSFGGSLDLSSLNGSNGFVINGIDLGDSSGNSVSSAGDVNGDIINDLIIGARRADPNGNTYAGESYVVFGISDNNTEPLNLKGGQGKDTLIGGGGDDILDGGNGQDELFGKGGNDTLLGGNGKDLLNGGLGNDLLNGGQGKDSFVLAKSGEGTDTIEDFNKDLIGLSGGISFNDLSFAGNDIILLDTNEILATLTGVDTTTLSSNDFTTV